MSLYHVLYDAERVEEFEKDIRPLLEVDCECIAYKTGVTGSLTKDSKVLVWLGDEPLYELLPLASEQQWAIGFLPHPDMNRVYRSFFVSKKMDEALEDINGTTEPVSADLMFCNQQLVLGSVMFGDSDNMRPAASIDNHVWSKLANLFFLTKNLSKTHLTAYKIETEKGSVVNTAALGITVVYRTSGSDFTRRIVEENTQDEAYLNAIILAPRSTSEVIKFLVSRLFLSKESVKNLATYLGHIKSPNIAITSNQLTSFSLDGNLHEAEKVELTVKPNAIKILSQKLPKKQADEQIKESVRVSFLPKGQSVQELIKRPLPWIHHADPDEIKETFLNLKENARTSESYLVLMVLSTLLATVGLFANSAPVIIGAMILAPLMSPIISLAMGVLRQSSDLVVTSGKTLVTGILVALAFGTLLTLLIPLHTINSEIGARLSPNILDLAIAIISGIAAAYASARSEVAKSLAGVAIAVALVPPLAVSGIGIGWLEWDVFWGAFLLFITNFFGIVLAAAMTFLVMGFSPFHLAKRGVAWSMLIVALVSVPLVFAFNTMVDEQRARYALDGWKSNGIEVRVIKILSNDPMYISVKLVSEKKLLTHDIDKIKTDMEDVLGRKIQLEATTAVVR